MQITEQNTDVFYQLQILSGSKKLMWLFFYFIGKLFRDTHTHKKKIIIITKFIFYTPLSSDDGLKSGIGGALQKDHYWNFQLGIEDIVKNFTRNVDGLLQTKLGRLS